MKKTASRASSELVKAIALAGMLTGSAEAIPLKPPTMGVNPDVPADAIDPSVAEATDTSIGMVDAASRNADIEHVALALDEVALIDSARLIDTQIT